MQMMVMFFSLIVFMLDVTRWMLGMLPVSYMLMILGAEFFLYMTLVIVMWITSALNKAMHLFASYAATAANLINRLSCILNQS